MHVNVCAHTCVEVGTIRVNACVCVQVCIHASGSIGGERHGE